MDATYKNGNIYLKNLLDFDIEQTFDCGQCFRFNRVSPNRYFGIAFEKPLEIEQSGDEVILYNTSEEDFYNIWIDFLDLKTDYGNIKNILTNSDAVMSEAVKYGSGIRILRQDTWETIVSFIISASNNIPRIKGIIERLCENFGKQISYKGKVYFSFPSAKKIQALSLEELSVIRAGFRDKYIKAAAYAILSASPSIEELRSMTTPAAKKSLMSINGIGNKVSDCILLFGLGRANSFPVDVWIKRIMEYCYFDGEQPINTIRLFAENKFGELGGYAQQYLFYYARKNKLGIDKT